MADIVNAGANSREVTFRGGIFPIVPKPAYSWATFLATIALWQLACNLGWVRETFLPSPLAIVQSLIRLGQTGELWGHLNASLGRIGAAWLIGTVLALVSGIAMGLASSARAIGMPLVSALYPIPKIALLPLLILWLGIGEAPKLVTIASGVYFPTVIATIAGVDAVPRNLIQMGRSFNLSVGAIIWKIILPSSLPGILAGFRISISTALILVVAAEMLGAEQGIGAFLLTAGNLMQSDDLLAGVVVLSILGLGFGALITFAEKTLLRWR